MSYDLMEPSGSVVSQGEFLPHPFVRKFVGERLVCATVPTKQYRPHTDYCESLPPGVG